MKLDDVLESWRSQDEAPLYSVNNERLQQALRQELAAVQRGLRIEAWAIYGISALMFAGLAFIFVIMVYDDDPRTWWDFVIVILGAAAALLWAGYLYLNRRMHARRVPAVRHRAPPGPAGLPAVPSLATVQRLADRVASVCRHARALAGHRANEQSAD